MLCQFNILSAMRSFCDVIETDNYVILDTLQNFHFRGLQIWNKNMANQILAKYLRPILF